MSGTSPFSIEFWVNRGYTEEDADFKRNSFRPIRKEYWMVKGHSEEDAIALAIKTKNDNNKKGAKKSSERSAEEFNEASVRRKEYWIKRGYSEEDALNEVAKVQSTFSLEKCIEQHGVEMGYVVWKDRQDKWQNTINSKSVDELKVINSKKCSIVVKSSIQETIDYYKKTRNMDLFGDLNSYRESVIVNINIKPNLAYYEPINYIDKQCSEIQIKLLGLTKEELAEKISDLFSAAMYLLKNKKISCYTKWVKQGYLRSSYEIYFYDKFTKTFPDVELFIDNPYPNSSFRYDFKIADQFIEICPMYDNNVKYREKMNIKERLFNSILLKTTKDIDKFIMEFKNEHNVG